MDSRAGSPTLAAELDLGGCVDVVTASGQKGGGGSPARRKETVMGAPRTSCPDLLDSSLFMPPGCAIRNEGTHRMCHLLICATECLSAGSRLSRERPVMSALCLAVMVLRRA